MNKLQLASVLAGALIAAGVILLGIVVVLKNRIARKGHSRKRLRVSEQDMRELVDDLEQLTLQINERIESRLKDLQNLLGEIDDKITATRTAVADGNELKVGDDSDIRPEGSSEPLIPHSEVTTGDDALDPQQEQILHLKAQGLSTIEIARRMEVNVGEVELVLNLYVPKPKLN
jgi:DNA-binding NarL/FixJ family response regulator